MSNNCLRWYYYIIEEKTKSAYNWALLLCV
uniref:Uncharacterized protein n=1 Tax=Siphoviridae sp. ctzjp2 TaxID=2826532 RepID=A0A8S5QMA5_9CAUD|nr:MAG TPA: hypothetical protein [Siphoviridae sp. ctzjp2]DAS65182.1 MAG TPA: hypothetical protein [Caudoviricetes sp.]DAY31929.1 MAG TPA: hypothetical protein [Caudoviricetes sp.]